VPASAVGPMAGPVTVLNPACDPGAVHADLTTDPAGISHGFVNLWGSDCNATDVITYVQGRGTGWTRVTSPYRGFPLATAWDSTGTYLLFVNRSDLSLRIAKRTTGGTFGATRVLSDRVSSDGTLLSADLVASGGRWWAVWREHVTATGGEGDEFAQTELFQAYTFGDGKLHPRERVTNRPEWDGAPSLAMSTTASGPGYPIRMVWTRGESDFGGTGTGTDIWIATATKPGVWSSSKAMATLGTNNFWPDVVIAGSKTFVTWNRDGRTLAAYDSGSSWVTKSFLTLGIQHIAPRIDARDSTVAVAWTAVSGASYRTYLAELAGGTWTGSWASAPTAALQFLVAVGTQGNKSRAFTFTDGAALSVMYES
jgi:hypothetical protein